MLDLLLVDGDSALTRALTARLESDGHRVRTAADGVEASAILGLESFDVVVTALDLKGIDGLTLFRRIRRDQPHTELLILSSSAKISEALTCLSEGAFDYLVKPFAPEDLEDRIARVELRHIHSEVGGEARSNADDLLDGKIGHPTILQIDDDPEDRQRVARHLGEEGFIGCALEQVRTLQEGLERLKKQEFLAVLLDLHLPDAQDLDGIERIQNLAPSTPIIVLSGVDDESLAVRAVQLGAQDYLAKSALEGKELRRALRYAIERKHTEQRLVQMAHYDQLTSLANRTLFRERLQQARARARRDKSMLGMMFLDLDRLKSVNREHGRKAGDTILQEVGRRLRAAVREHDTVARVGGDEFAVLLENLSSKREATLVAERILGVLAKPVPFNGTSLAAAANIGIAVSPEAGDSTGDLVRYADTAMYEAKLHGANRYRLFGDDEDAEARERMDAELFRAYMERQFLLHYQPLFSLSKQGFVGVEALLRWRKPDGEIILPTIFIPALERSGLIVDVGRRVLADACGQLKKWRDAGLSFDRIGVNLSAVQFEHDGIADQIVRTARSAGIEAESLEVEITESLLMRDTAHTANAMAELKDHGVRIAIDDFGTGYSSLAYLHRFPVDTLKIDRSFVERIGPNGRGTAIVGAIIQLAHKLGIEVIAEGVETEEQVAFLRNEGCDLIQGYLSGRPTAP